MTTQSLLQGALRAGIASDATRVGPFLVVVDADSTNPFRNFAVPDDDAAPTPEDVAALVQWFADHDRLPRLECVRPAPAIEAALAAGGFTVAKSFPLLVLDELVPVDPPPGIRV